jgi:hypothetical protein
VSVRQGNVVMNLVGPHGESMVLGVPPDAARDFALALDEAAETAEQPEPAPDEQRSREADVGIEPSTER